MDEQAELRQLGEWVRRAGLEAFVRRQMQKRSARVFVYGAVPPHGRYGWIVEEDPAKPNPYFIVEDGIKAGLWYRSDQFRRVIEGSEQEETTG